MFSDDSTRATTGEVLTAELEAGIVQITLNNPDQLNPLSMTLVAELHEALDAVEADPEVRVVILTGAGRGFCSGMQIKAATERTGSTPGQNPLVSIIAPQERIAALHERIHHLRVPVIAAVNGPAVGGGFSLALACDVRIAAQTARFGAVFITLGVSASDMGTSYFLPRLVGASRAAELMLTGRIFDAAEAREIGLVLDVVAVTAGDELIERALVTARAIAANSPMAVWMTKSTMWCNLDAPSLRHAMELENRTQVMCTTSGEMARAMDAFVSRSSPQWLSL